MAIAGAICALSALALGDEVILRDGTVYTGTIVSKTRRVIQIDTTIHGISTRLKVDRRQIKSITEGETPSTSDETPAILSTPTPTLPKVSEPTENPNKVLKRKGYNLLMEVPLKGTFGKDIYPLAIADSLEWAVKHGVTDVVFRINSGGGEVWAAMDMVQIMNEYRGKVKMHMLVESAISASIWPTLTCDTITMAPGSDFGGAVVYTHNSTGSAEVDLKMNGIWAAKLESAADANGYSGYIVRAMMLSKAAVYAYQKDGQWVLSDTTEGIPSNYETIDSPDTVLTLTANQAIKYGIVKAMPDGKSLEDFAKAQGIEKWDSAGEIGDTIVERDVKKSKRLRDQLTAVVNGFRVETAAASKRQYVSTLGSSLQTMRKELGTYKRLMKQAKAMHMPSIIDSFDEAIDVDFWENEIETRMAELRRMRRNRP